MQESWSDKEDAPWYGICSVCGVDLMEGEKGNCSNCPLKKSRPKEEKTTPENVMGKILAHVNRNQAMIDREEEETLWNQFVARLPQCDALEDADDLQGALRGVAVHHDECSCDALLYIRQYADGHVTVEYPELRDVTSHADLEALKAVWDWEDEENAQAEQVDKAKRRRARAYKCTCAHCGGFIGLEREAHCDTFGTCEGCQGEGADGFDVAELVLQGANPEPRNLDCMDARELFQESIREGTPQAYRAYAAMKREAVLKRLAGEIQWAMDLEANADKLYKKIPAEWKW